MQCDRLYAAQVNEPGLCRTLVSVCVCVFCTLASSGQVQRDMSSLEYALWRLSVLYCIVFYASLLDYFQALAIACAVVEQSYVCCRMLLALRSRRIRGEMLLADETST